MVAEAQLALHHRVAEVDLVAIREQLDIADLDWLVVIDPEGQRKPVGKDDQILVRDRAPAEDRGFPVVHAVCVGTGIVVVARRFPLGRAASAEVAVPGRGRGLPERLVRSGNPA